MSQKMLRKPGLRSYSLKDVGRVYGYEGCFIATAALGLMWGLTMGAVAMSVASLGVSGWAALSLGLSTVGMFNGWYRACVR